MEYPWYTKVGQKDDLQQGDFIFNCPVIVPPEKFSSKDVPEVDVKVMDAIVLTQSCDLANKSIEIILVCRYFSLKEFLDDISQEHLVNAKSRKNIIDNLRKGFLVSYHLLNKQDDVFDDYLVVDFKSVFGVHRNAIRNSIDQMKERIQLLPPYREHLSQAFARYFMRVGLPQDITIEGY